MIKKNNKLYVTAILVVFFIGTIIYIKNNEKYLHKLTKKNELRGCDLWGCGSFKDSRTNEAGIHEGLDILVTPDETIFSPINGEMIRMAYPYTDKKYEGVLIKNDIYEIKIFYFKPFIKPGDKIKKGQIIGIAQNISEKFSSTMKPHIHIEVRTNKGELINPLNLFR